MTNSFFQNASRFKTALLRVGLPVVIILLVWMVAGLRLSKRVQQEEQDKLHDVVHGISELIEHTAHGYLHYLHSVEAFVLAELDEDHSISDIHFTDYAHKLFRYAGPFKTLILSPGGIHRFAYPPEMQEKVIGYDLLFDPREEVQDDITRILETEQFVCSGPYPMVNDTGTVFVFRKSIFYDTKFWGIASLIIDFHEFMESIDLQALSGGTFGIRDKITGEILSGPESVWTKSAVVQSSVFADSEWEVAGASSVGSGAGVNRVLIRFWLGGIIIATLTGLLSYRTYQNRFQLNDMVHERTQQLQESLEYQETLRQKQEQTSRALQESEERYRTFVQQISEGVYRIEFKEPISTELPADAQIRAVYDYGIVAECNSTLAEMLQFPDEKALQGMTLESLHGGRNNSEKREILQKLIESGYHVKDHLLVETDDSGQQRYFLNTVLGIVENGHLIRAWGTQRDITHRYLAEKYLQKSQEQLSLAMEGADLGLWDWDLQTGEVIFNDRWCEMLGYKQSELEGHVSTWETLLHPDDYHETLEILQAHLDGENEQYESVHRLKTKAGDYKWILDSGKVIERDENGNPARAAGIHQDITQMKEAEIALRDSEERYRDIFQNAPIGIFLSTSSGRFLDVNNAAVELLGYNSRGHLLSQVVNLGAQVYKDPERRAQFLQELQEQGEVIDFEIEAQKRDGESIWLSLDAKIQMWDNDTDFKIFGFISDKTQQKRIEHALQKSEQQYRLLADTAQEMIVMHRLDGTVEYVNPAVEKLTGFTPRDAYKNDISIFMAPDSLRDIQRRNEQRRAGDNNQLLYNIHVKKKDGGYLPVEASSTPVMMDGKINGILIVARDISEKLKLQQQLVQAQKMEAIGRLAGGVAHDFNNLLTIINGYSALVLSQIPSGGPYYDEITNIHDAGEKAENLTRQLLTFSRKQELELSNINLNETILGVEKMLQRLIGEHIRLKTDLTEQIETIYADKGQIEQIIMNLSVNARDAMPEGGDLLIETGREHLSRQNNNFDFEVKTGEYNRLTVSDTGTGIDKSIIQNIFEPFFTTKEAGKGTGLGLATVYGIVKQHNGYISVDSQPGKGTIFHIYFPAAQNAEEDVMPDNGSAVDTTGTENILVVEDDEIVRQLVTRSLRAGGYGVSEFGRARPALESFTKNPELFDLILTDIVMPEMSGVDLVNSIRGMNKDVEILLMSGYTDDTLDNFSIDSFQNFIQKPFTPQQLMERIRYLLDRQSHS